jgi:hypothetical protein
MRIAVALIGVFFVAAAVAIAARDVRGGTDYDRYGSRLALWVTQAARAPLARCTC